MFTKFKLEQILRYQRLKQVHVLSLEMSAKAALKPQQAQKRHAAFIGFSNDGCTQVTNNVEMLQRVFLALSQLQKCKIGGLVEFPGLDYVVFRALLLANTGVPLVSCVPVHFCLYLPISSQVLQVVVALPLVFACQYIAGLYAKFWLLASELGYSKIVYEGARQGGQSRPLPV